MPYPTKHLFEQAPAPPTTTRQLTPKEDVIVLAGAKLYEALATLPPSRERSIAETKVDEAMMWVGRLVLRPPAPPMSAA